MSWRQSNSFLATAGRFSIVGIINTGLGFLAIFSLMAAGLDPFISNALGYAVGFCISFLLHKGWVFNEKGRSFWQVARYTASVAFAYTVNIYSLSILLKMDFWPYLAQVVAAIAYTGILFLLSKQWVFQGDGKAR